MPEQYVRSANDQGNYTAETPPARRAGDAQARRTVRHFTTLLAGTNVIALIDIAISVIAVTSVAASQRGLPVSLAMIAVNSALLLSSNPAKRSTTT